MKIEHISISRESCFLECQQKYKFRYHLQTVTDEPEPFYFVFGKIVHKIIEEHTRAKGKKDLTSVTKSVLSGKVPLEPEIVEKGVVIRPAKKAPRLDSEHQNKLIRMLRHYERMCEKTGFGGEIEWKFAIDMDGKGRKMTGFIDRLIINKSNKAFILDYKTTKPGNFRKNARTIGKDLQLQCYAYVVNKECGIPVKDIEAALFYLDDNKVVPTKFKEDVVMQVPERLLARYKEIEELDAERVYGNVGNHCKRCDYRKICPFWALT